MQRSSGVSIINPAVLEQASDYQNEFVSATPFPHLAIDNFLTPAFAQALLDTFPAFERGNTVGDSGELGGKSTVDKVRQLGPAYEQLDDAIKSPEFLKAVGALTGIDGLIYDPWYLGGGTHENRNGMALDPHVDFNYHPSERWHRRLNLIIYLNPGWADQWGGCLELFRDPHVDPRPSRSIGPSYNRCVIFETSEKSWHAFDQIRLPAEQQDLSRRSIALYFYTKDRPAEETAARHTTFYVNRQLPEHIQEGHTLSRNDVANIKQLLEARDGHISMLYGENTALRKAQDRGLTGHLLYLAKRAYVRYRR
ncbi:Proline 4-hydroxylase (includes Rps23 Pro-64 3,4-dihydroxylase Tpa1), contains SM-20 domain [Dyella sp. OK004]|uniref:2OG-Fe(II) oxygenase n=1 Tax=Dyella sp. OK004 TaxID=1855292 RepID=UPI0008E6FEB9|nr:2OG-Fe(II) oxygenase [Dyella sp. OK004]SFS01677.1 Proline 4-hydroxylase (includes Rps23 Pro-64 3,4-dihydroxylase Tpa1), contains SM-20 domain [Dyella sp. OK004]